MAGLKSMRWTIHSTPRYRSTLPTEVKGDVLEGVVSSRGGLRCRSVECGMVRGAAEQRPPPSDELSQVDPPADAEDATDDQAMAVGVPVHLFEAGGGR